MANSRRRPSEGSSGRSSFSARGLHFFKLIHSGISRDRKLMIPTKFVKKHGNDLSNRAFLKVPTGAIWQVGMTNSNGKVWLHNDDWEKFKEYYSIRYGHFLVFRYDGNSQFQVFIFDKSTTEIEYPFRAIHGGQAKLNGEFGVPKKECIDTNDSLEVLDDFPSCQTGDKAPIKKVLSVEKGFPACKGKNTSIPKLEKSGKHQDSHGVKQEIKKECCGDIPTTDEHLQSKGRHSKSVAANEKFRAFQRANAFKSNNPHIKVYMQPSYVCLGFNLNISLSFMKEHFTDKQDIVLRVSDGRTWSVKCNLGTGNAKIYSTGWKSFVNDNNVKVGDVCVFELVKSTLPTLKVVIFRAVEYAKGF